MPAGTGGMILGCKRLSPVPQLRYGPKLCDNIGLQGRDNPLDVLQCKI